MPKYCVSQIITSIPSFTPDNECENLIFAIRRIQAKNKHAKTANSSLQHPADYFSNAPAIQGSGNNTSRMPCPFTTRVKIFNPRMHKRFRVSGYFNRVACAGFHSQYDDFPGKIAFQLPLTGMMPVNLPSGKYPERSDVMYSISEAYSTTRTLRINSKTR